MDNEFRTGRPPIWRVVIYALVAMAIPIYFFYPRLGELSPQLRVLFWFTVVFLGGGMVVYFALLPSIVRMIKSGTMKQRRFIRTVLVLVILFGIVCRMLGSIHWK
jgi:hypothetical protein